MDPLDIIYTYYPPDDPLTGLLIQHSEQVRDKALSIARAAPRLDLDLEFIGQAAMLHDIGIFETHSPKILCQGDQPYICHGVIGRDLLERQGLTKHALVCERHVGVGISRQDILTHNMPLPPRDMLPLSIEEIIISYADEFYSKTNGGQEHSFETVISGIRRYGREKVNRFMKWHSILSA